MSHDPSCRCFRAAEAAAQAEAIQALPLLDCGCGGAYACKLCGRCLTHDHRTVQEQEPAKDMGKEPIAAGVDFEGKPFQIWGPDKIEPGLKRLIQVCPDGTKTPLSDWGPGTIFGPQRERKPS